MMAPGQNREEGRRVDAYLDDCPHNRTEGDNYGWRCLDCGYEERFDDA